MQKISICDHKGGVGKTSSAVAIAQGLNDRKKPKSKALLIDCDPQGTATKSCYGVTTIHHSLYDVIKGTCKAEEAIISTEAGDIIPYSKQLANIDIEFNNDPSAYHRIKEGLADLEGYTHIIFDTAPGLTLATLQALTASDGVVIPIWCSPDNFDNLKLTYNNIQIIRKYNNPDLKILGVFFTQHTGNSNLMKQFEDLYQDTCKSYGITLLKTSIRRSITIQESHALAQSLFDYAPRATVTQEYSNLIKELKL